MAVTASTTFESRWDPARVAGGDELDALVYRSNLLAAERAIVNFGGGNTSVKVVQPDHTGRETAVLWVKGSGSDLATIERGGFTGLRLDEILPLVDREAMTDEEMVAYLARCQLDPGDAETVDRDAAARLHPASPRRSHPPGRDRLDRGGERRRAACRGVLRRRGGLDPVHQAGLRALEARRRGRGIEPGREDRPARQARARDLGLDGRRVLRRDARRDQPRGRIRRGSKGRRAVRWAAAPGPGRRAPPRAARRGAPRAPRRRLDRRPPRPPGRPLTAGARVRRRARVARALPGRRRLPRPSRAYEAASGLGRVRSRARRRERAARAPRRAGGHLPRARAGLLRAAPGRGRRAPRSEPTRHPDRGGRARRASGGRSKPRGWPATSTSAPSRSWAAPPASAGSSR